MRTKGSSGAKTRDAIFAAGLQLIYRYGYEAASLRRIAAEVGIREGSLYNHIASKQALLFQLVEDHMDRLLASLDAALRGVSGFDARIRAFIAFHLTYHMERQAEVFVINSELRSLEAESRAAIIAKRDRYEAALVDILREGAVAEPAIAAKAIIAMLTGICTWFRPGGRLSIDRLVDLYTQLVLDGVGNRHPRATVTPA
jgi:AcrR family transcriptional regulator